MRLSRLFFTGFLTFFVSTVVVAAESPSTPEEVLRALVQANAGKDLATMRQFMAGDADTISYTIGGRKYVGWSEFARDMQLEFASVERLDIPITDLKVWTHGDLAWFAMELDYIRYTAGERAQGTMIPLRETGVLERRDGKWILVAWHESMRAGGGVHSFGSRSSSVTRPINVAKPYKPDLSGEWEIQEEDKSYTATLDPAGNGAYTWQNGRIVTTGFTDQQWHGTWHQSGNDREGAFEVLLSEDGTEARGVWWYTRVGDKSNIPPRQWGGSYVWKRLTPPPRAASTP
ncbi:MAG TPA: nuclear transport factor 2 family protein [Nitrospiraceae bacterium]|nr:nuclear transport factor 2 family protein [Nitrospiraceae bacterium]